jgi:hypothetical protein
VNPDPGGPKTRGSGGSGSTGESIEMVNVRKISHLNKIGILLNLGQEHAEELHLLALCGRRLKKTCGKKEEMGQQRQLLFTPGRGSTSTNTLKLNVKLNVLPTGNTATKQR